MSDPKSGEPSGPGASPRPPGGAAPSAPDTGAAIAFLERLHSGRARTLASFRPRPAGRTLPAASLDETREWIERYNPGTDTYVVLGICKGAPNGQPKKEEMVGSEWLWVDIDPRAGEDLVVERDRILRLLTADLPKDVPRPTLVVDSGRGFWGLWQLAEPLLDPDMVERTNLGLADAFGCADKCWNINRVGRLPGTRNTKTGRLAKVLSDDPRPVYEPSDFPTSAAPASVAPVPEVAKDIVAHRIEDLADLDEWGVSKRLKSIIARGEDPERPKESDNSRSAWLFDVVCNLKRKGVPDEVILGLIMDPRWRISESVLEKGANAEKYAIKQIASAREARAEFRTDKDGRPVSSQRNIRVALLRMGVRLQHDKFADRLLVDGLTGFGPALQDEAVTRLWLQIEERFEFRPRKDFFWMVIEDLARQAGFHPVRDYLDGLTWDGTTRVDQWLVRYGEAEDNEYTRAVGALTLVAAVRRARQPGCKFDEMLVLESPQGQRKSTALRTLAVREDWFSDDLPLSADTKVVIERLHGRWIVEASELKGMRKGEVEHLKAFLSRQEDRARMAYGRIPKEVPRQSVLIGTTNSGSYLRDGTGNRRFWPVRVGTFDIAALRRDRDQLWAEAAQREAADDSIRLDPKLYPAAAEQQEQRRIEDPFVGTLNAALKDMHGKIRANEVWRIIDVPTGQRTQEHNNRMGEAMRELGWERKKLRFGGPNPEWAYVRGDGPENELFVVVDEDGAVARVVDGRPGVAF